MRSPRLAAITLKRLFSDSLLVRAAVVAITLVPLLYGAMYLWAFWDPYGKLDKMPVALVNLDVPATVDAETIAAGADLTKALVETGTVEWHVVSSDEASAGLASGRYYLALTIPEEFSADLATANTKHPVAREAARHRAGVVEHARFTDRVARLRRDPRAAGEDATKRYLDNIYVGFDDARGGFADAAAGARSLAEGLADARSGARTLAHGTSTARSGAFALAGGLLKLDRGVTSRRRRSLDCRKRQRVARRGDCDTATVGRRLSSRTVRRRLDRRGSAAPTSEQRRSRVEPPHSPPASPPLTRALRG